MGRGDIISSETYGTSRANAYKILEDTLNLKDVRIYDTIEDEEGRLKRILNKKDTMLAQQKQQVIKDAFANWIWQDPQRRISLVRQYNELFNSSRPREYDGSHIHFVGMNRRSPSGNTSAMPLLMCFMAVIRYLHTKWERAKHLKWRPPQWKPNGWGCVRKAFLSFPTI